WCAACRDRRCMRASQQLHRNRRSAKAEDVRASHTDDGARSLSPAHDAGIVQGSEKKSACASSIAPYHHDRRYPIRQQQPLSHIVIPRRRKRSVPRPMLSADFRCKTRSDLGGNGADGILMPAACGYFFSITHCRGCWCLRAKSMTCVPLVSAISY